MMRALRSKTWSGSLLLISSFHWDLESCDSEMNLLLSFPPSKRGGSLVPIAGFKTMTCTQMATQASLCSSHHQCVTSYLYLLNYSRARPPNVTYLKNAAKNLTTNHEIHLDAAKALPRNRKSRACDENHFLCFPVSASWRREMWRCEVWQMHLYPIAYKRERPPHFCSDRLRDK